MKRFKPNSRLTSLLFITQLIIVLLTLSVKVAGLTASSQALDTTESTENLYLNSELEIRGNTYWDADRSGTIEPGSADFHKSGRFIYLFQIVDDVWGSEPVDWMVSGVPESNQNPNHVVKGIGNGEFGFGNLDARRYAVCEAVKEGWVHTGYAPNDPNNFPIIAAPENLRSEYLLQPNCVSLHLAAGEISEQLNFLSYPETILRINKSNSRYKPETGTVVEESRVGDQLTFTLKLKALENLHHLVVYDTLPESILFRGGVSAVSSVQGTLSPEVNGYEDNKKTGIWEFLTVEEGEELTLQYIGEISSESISGDYLDSSWAKAIFDEEALQFSTESRNPETLQPTEDLGYFSTSLVRVTQAGAGGNSEVTPAETIQLPNTGNNAVVTLTLILLFSVGAILFLSSVLPKPVEVVTDVNSSSKKAVNAIIISIFLLTTSTTSIYAVEPISIQISQPKSPTSSKNIYFDYVVQNSGNESIDTNCYLKKGSDQYQIIQSQNYDEGVGNGRCVLPTQLASDGDYTVYVEAVSPSLTVNSKEVSFTIDTTAPGIPLNYRKERNICAHTLFFSSADDGDTAFIQIFRSQEEKFVADSSTEVETITVKPNQERLYKDQIANCNSAEYYYALRSIDRAGNRSPFITDSLEVASPVVSTDQSRRGGGRTLTLSEVRNQENEKQIKGSQSDEVLAESDQSTLSASQRVEQVKEKIKAVKDGNETELLNRTVTAVVIFSLGALLLLIYFGFRGRMGSVQKKS